MAMMDFARMVIVMGVIGFVIIYIYKLIRDELERLKKKKEKNGEQKVIW